MDKYFYYEEFYDEKKVKHAITRLKGHATLWWDELQDDRRSKGKQKIKSWDIMVAKLKDKFIPKYYQINLFRRLQNPRRKGLTIKQYTKEFYKLSIRVGQREKDDENVVRYINGLIYEIQDEINMITVRTVEDYYQIAQKVEDKLARKQSQINRGKTLNRGKGIVHDKAKKPKVETRKPHSHSERGGISRGRQYGGMNAFPQGRGRGRGGEVKCYACGKT
jgi:hypothetical protein